MKLSLRSLIVPIAATLLAGCPINDNGSRRTAPGADGNALPEEIVFSTFVKRQLELTSDISDPAPVNAVSFDFRDLENPDAFNDVLAP